MRFFIGTIVSTLILSPVSVLSMVLDTPVSSLMTQVKVHDGTLQRQYHVASTPIGSSLQKRFCIGRCSKKHKSWYQCKKKSISTYRIKKAKDAACPKIKANQQKNAFPSLHTALKFDTPGPYVEWPIKRNGRFWNKCESQDTFNTLIIVAVTVTITAIVIATAAVTTMAYNDANIRHFGKSKYRIVLTQDCKVVGAAIRNKDGSYIRCLHMDDEEDDIKDSEDNDKKDDEEND
ncbi:hypothetical protein EPUL_006019, partial [Erysiphe pulchra]